MDNHIFEKWKDKRQEYSKNRWDAVKIDSIIKEFLKDGPNEEQFIEMLDGANLTAKVLWELYK